MTELTREALVEFKVIFKHLNKDKLPHERLFINTASCSWIKLRSVQFTVGIFME